MVDLFRFKVSLLLYKYNKILKEGNIMYIVYSVAFKVCTVQEVESPRLFDVPLKRKARSRPSQKSL